MYSINTFTQTRTHWNFICAMYIHTQQSTPLFPSKAFDSVNHWKLFRKLIIRKVPLMIVRMLIFWYSMQEMCIK